MISKSEVQERLALAETLAREVGVGIRKYFKDGVSVETKADDSPVTVADQESEQYIRARIKKDYPADGILGEEYGEEPGTSGIRWTIDPIDGTKSFVCGVPLFGTLIGIESGERTEAGLIYMTMFDEMYSAARGSGATCNGVPCHVSETENLKDAVLVSSGLEYYDETWRVTFANLIREVRFCRTWGDCYGWTLLLRGRVDVAFDPGLKPWDYSPFSVLVDEAGGRIHSIDHSDVPGTLNYVGANPRLLERVRALMPAHAQESNLS